MNIPLKIAILKQTSQRILAKKIGSHPNIISMIVHGRYNPDQAQKKKIAKVLDCKTEDIFPESQHG